MTITETAYHAGNIYYFDSDVYHEADEEELAKIDELVDEFKGHLGDLTVYLDRDHLTEEEYVEMTEIETTMVNTILELFGIMETLQTHPEHAYAVLEWVEEHYKKTD